MRRFCCGRIVMGTALAGKGVILFGIIMQRDMRVSIETGVNGGLRFWWNKLIKPGNVQHKRGRNIFRLSQNILNTDPVIADIGVGVGAGRA